MKNRAVKQRLADEIGFKGNIDVNDSIEFINAVAEFEARYPTQFGQICIKVIKELKDEVRREG